MSMLVLVGFQALLAAGLCACLYLFASAKQELRAADKRWQKRLESTQAEAEKLRAELAETRERVRDNEESSGLLVAPQPTMSGLNLGKRSQAIRLSRRGEEPDRIAATLRLPKREVELLLRVHRIALSAPLEEPKLQSQ